MIERALALQAGRDKALDPEWLDLLESARRKGQLTEAQLARYLRNAIDWRLMTAAAARSGGRVRFGLQGVVDRLAPLASGDSFTVTAAFAEGRLGGQGLRAGSTKDPFGTPARSVALVPGALLEVVDAAGFDADVGDQTLAMDWQVTLYRGAGKGPALSAWVETVKAPVSVAAWRSRQLDEPDDEAPMLRALPVRVATLTRDASGVCWAGIDFKPRALPGDLVATLKITTEDGMEYRSVDPVLLTARDPLWRARAAAVAGAGPWRVRVALDGAPAGDTARVELVPHPAAETLTLSEPLWMGGALRYEKVDLRRPTSGLEAGAAGGAGAGGGVGAGSAGSR